MQFVPVDGRTNPRTDSAHALSAATVVHGEVQHILASACQDCHSNDTRWPWYSKVAPASLLLMEDVQHGRRALNFSEWTVRTGAKPARAMGLLTAVCEDVQSRRMPPGAYQWLHPEARLTSVQIETLCGWTRSQTALLRSEMIHRAAARVPSRPK
jgi:uncharacterized membrane protein